MSKEVISVKIKKDGTILWDRYTPDQLNTVLCPKRDKLCNIFCPLVLIEEDGEHIVFACGGVSMKYKTEPFASKNIEEDERHD